MYLNILLIFNTCPFVSLFLNIKIDTAVSEIAAIDNLYI